MFHPARVTTTFINYYACSHEINSSSRISSGDVTKKGREKERETDRVTISKRSRGTTGVRVEMYVPLIITLVTPTSRSAVLTKSGKFFSSNAPSPLSGYYYLLVPASPRFTLSIFLSPSHCDRGPGRSSRREACTRLTLILLPTEILIKKLALITRRTRACGATRRAARRLHAGTAGKEAPRRKTRRMRFNQRFVGSASLPRFAPVRTDAECPKNERESPRVDSASHSRIFAFLRLAVDYILTYM